MQLEIDSTGAFSINDVQFMIDMGWAGQRSKSDNERFTIVKNKTYFEFYETLIPQAPKSIFEIGFFEGGSSVFFREYFGSHQLTAVDRRAAPIDPVEAYIDDRDLRDQFRMVYGFDQGDQTGLQTLVNTHHGGVLDLVIDDASHQYALSKKTFEALFPMVRAGGTYILEDYGWAHDRRYQDSDHIWAQNPSLANLVFELIVLLPSVPGLIDKIEVNRGLVAITKGPNPATQDLLNIDDSMLLRGRSFSQI